jgi:hypothetical protein
MTHRLIEVAASRLPRWLAGFVDLHGAAVVGADGDFVTLTAADGSVASLEVPFGRGLPPGEDFDVIGRWLTERVQVVDAALVLLVRRGGYAVGACERSALVSHKVGTRYVQGRTAAGGWSQQRFARRRSGQTAELVGAATGAAVAVFARAGSPRCLVVGGDRSLIEAVLADRRLTRVAGLPRTPVLDVPDPRLAGLSAALGRARAIRVRVDD